ncbi:MAG: lysine--tRNA ligase [Holosporaceae bacterium]|jgi:lysyl-tRNA synthetase class 1|nr:lysine--tRNA ligase [Holosporaceae bacterium]
MKQNTCTFAGTIYENARSWPFEEAKKLRLRSEAIQKKGFALLETGYGPSGLPHIGTFGEVARTSFVKHAFQCLTGLEAKIYAFSDDRDGLRKVPDNIPNKDMVAKYLGYPLTAVPDPFGCHASFGEHNNHKLMNFLDSFGFEYEFQSSTDWYKSGRFNDVLLKVLHHHEEILEVMLASLREERAATYSPFLPISPKTGRVLQVAIEKYDKNAGTILFRDEDGTLTELPVTDGHCKMQWKVDWAARWVALDVDYEMAGKDLIDSVTLSSKICKILGGTPPAGFNYELFLDEDGKKISKSKGNGVSVDEWLRYAPHESLANYMFASPRSAKKLYFGVIPKQVDDYLSHLRNYDLQDNEKRVDNPVWHVHGGTPPKVDGDISFSLLLNLVSVCNTDSPEVLWGFIKKYYSSATPESDPFLDKLVRHSINYYQDFVKNKKVYSAPNDLERSALEDLLSELEKFPPEKDATAIQNVVFEVGKRHPNIGTLRQWFMVLYRHLFAQEEGPRLGTFMALYGIDNSRKLIQDALARQ